MSYVFGLDLIALLAVLGAALWGAVRCVLRIPLRRVAVESVFVGYLLAVTVVVLAPFGRAVEPGGQYLATAINLVPFFTMVELVRQFPGQVVRQLGGNAAMFAPLGFLLPALFAHFRKPRAVAATALIVSCGIEAAQLGMRLMSMSSRSFDIDDVILNVAGAMIGYGLWRAVVGLAGVKYPTAAGDSEGA